MEEREGLEAGPAGGDGGQQGGGGGGGRRGGRYRALDDGEGRGHHGGHGLSGQVIHKCVYVYVIYVRGGWGEALVRVGRSFKIGNASRPDRNLGLK